MNCIIKPNRSTPNPIGSLVLNWDMFGVIYLLTPFPTSLLNAKQLLNPSKLHHEKHRL